MLLIQRGAGEVTLLNSLRFLRPQDVPGLYFFMAVAANESDCDECLAFLVPLAPGCSSYPFAASAPNAGIRVCRIVSGPEETQLFAVKQVIA